MSSIEPGDIGRHKHEVASRSTPAVNARRPRLEELEPKLLLSAGDFSSLAAPVQAFSAPRSGVLLAADRDEARCLFDSFGNEYCELPAVDPGAAAAAAEEGVSAAPFPFDQTFLLHSNPSATKTIHLDFDGHTTVNTLWNWNYTDGDPIVTPSFSFQGDSSFTDAELERIQYIYQRVAEDFLPFDVNVTTEDPGAAALSKSGGGDDEWGIRVCIGGSNGWYGSGGGVAYVGSFTWANDVPAFVFPVSLGNGREKYVAEATSHETGHTLGLEHDGTSTTGYYEGHGSGDTGWAPIMGLAYYKHLSQWSKGEYADANNTQDDLNIITSSSNGFGYRADDHGDALGAATTLPVVDDSLSGEGIIERNTDVDYFEFSSPTGIIALSIDPLARGPNLDIWAQVYDDLGASVAASNSADYLSASFSLELSPGTYYLSVEGAGKGDPATGYSDYASLGYYSITGTVPETVADYGDAPSPTYPTLLADNGARHDLVEGGPVLGSAVDWEGDGQPTDEADGDDVLDGSDDEDGVALGPITYGATTAGVDVAVGSAAGGVLNAWIDFNADGDWADPGEQIFTDRPVGPGTNSLTYAVPGPAALESGVTYARFRISSAGGLSFDGPADDGEVEDYLVEVIELDFGDAPDPSYPTLLAGDGARHRIVSNGPFFGSLAGGEPDAEPDGQPTALADGDDTLDGYDDEGGVGVLPVVLGEPTGTAYVLAGWPDAGLLNGWIDFNADGDWTDTGEQIFTDVPLVIGTNVLTFAVPSAGSCVVGTTYARFRLSSAGGLSFDGPADDGEVEDYAVEILPAPSPIPGAPDLEAAGDTGAYSDDDLTKLDNSGPSKTLQFEVTGTVAGATVKIYAGGVEIGSEVAAGTTTTVATDGSHDLADGSHFITSRQTEPGKAESEDSAALPVTIDTAAPAVGVAVLATDDTTPPLAGTIDDSGAQIEVIVNGASCGPATNNGDGTWTLADDTIDPPLARGLYDVQAAATDLAGNSSGDATADELTVYGIEGDANLDGIVDGQDFTILKAHYGGPGNWIQGDFTADGLVEGQDFTVLKSRYGESEAPAAGEQAAAETAPRMTAPASGPVAGSQDVERIAGAASRAGARVSPLSFVPAAEAHPHAPVDVPAARAPAAAVAGVWKWPVRMQDAPGSLLGLSLSPAAAAGVLPQLHVDPAAPREIG